MADMEAWLAAERARVQGAADMLAAAVGAIRGSGAG
jgi:hypothetical protein